MYKGFWETDFPIFRSNREKRLGILLRAQGTRIFSSRQVVLRKYGGNEGGFSLCERCLSAFRG